MSNPNSSSNLVPKVQPLINSWTSASKYDHIYFNYKKISQHNDGWGSYQYFSTGTGKDHTILTKSSEPAFTENHDISIDSDHINNFILLNHARKASKSMPISLNQNHPFVNEAGTCVLAHNGNMNKEVVRSLLTNKPENMDNLSDTQLFFSLLKERFSDSMDQEELYKIWKELLIDLHKTHQKHSKDYSMNLIFLIKKSDNSSFYILYSSLFSKIEGERYYRLYVGEKNNQFFICSSTVFDYFEQDEQDSKKTWNIHSILNGTVGFLDSSTLHGKEENILATVVNN